MEYVYFIEEGLVSVSAKAAPDKWVEVWLIGSEGMTGLPILLQDTDAPPLRRTVLVGGYAYRMTRTAFRNLVDASAPLARIMLRYTEFILLQASQAHVCDAQHSLRQRLGRWLLLARDGLERDELPLTHQTLGRLLGVRRASVTECLQVLEKETVLQHDRGLVRIDAPNQLQALSCRCYSLISSEYRRLVR
ncbi:Crp/Fnr family transcriptional regulator [Microvirga sp. 2TAF3]|uniref:Crp/Fnr family transcriptional regulator n=1 Tax=Microvirga sp. 2TAF3 TaxID=3233014 RepID=UPI003F96E8B8